MDNKRQRESHEKDLLTTPRSRGLHSWMRSMTSDRSGCRCRLV